MLFRSNSNETFLDCAVRELIEETNIRVPEKVLRGSIVKTELFDSPKRSFGIPRNTLAVYFRINPDPDGGVGVGIGEGGGGTPPGGVGAGVGVGVGVGGGGGNGDVCVGGSCINPPDPILHYINCYRNVS